MPSLIERSNSSASKRHCAHLIRKVSLVVWIGDGLAVSTGVGKHAGHNKGG